jgi:hypothetical protein
MQITWEGFTENGEKFFDGEELIIDFEINQIDTKVKD